MHRRNSHLNFSVQLFYTLVDVPESDTIFLYVRGKAHSVVDDFYFQYARLFPSQMYPKKGGSGMFHDIADEFLNDSKDLKGPVVVPKHLAVFGKFNLNPFAIEPLNEFGYRRR